MKSRDHRSDLDLEKGERKTSSKNSLIEPRLEQLRMEPPSADLRLDRFSMFSARSSKSVDESEVNRLHHHQKKKASERDDEEEKRVDASKRERSE